MILRALLFCAAVLPLAQSQPSRTSPNLAKHGPPPVVAIETKNLGAPQLLDSNWHVGIAPANNLSPAHIAFDDSSWPLESDLKSLDDIAANSEAEAHDTNSRNYVWYRLHLKLPQQHGPLSLLFAIPVAQNISMALGTEGPAVDIFANGTQIQPEGKHGDDPQHYQQISRIYHLDIPANETSLTLAVRSLYMPFGLGTRVSFFSTHSLYIGQQNDLNNMLELWSIHTFFEHLPRTINSILTILLAIFLLVLYFTQKGHIEYLWLALEELATAPIGFLDIASNNANIHLVWYFAIVVQLALLSAYFEFEFLVEFLSIPRRWYIRILRYGAIILAAAGPMILLAGQRHANGIFLLLVAFGVLLWLGGWLLFTFCTLLAATLRRNFEAGVLLIPFVLGLVGVIEPMLTAGMSDWGGRPFHSPLSIQAGPIPIHFSSISEFVGLLAIVLIIFGRFLKVQRNQERSSSELAAARTVQELMIPIEKVKTPGFEVDSVYTPANEVGGDFFHIQPIDDGDILVVLGDVAGKGLKAAMNVSMLIGALRQTAEKSPARILELLNRVLHGSESLTTCQAACFRANGELILANAGHLPPYLNSQEIAIPGSLPLGVLPDAHYDELCLYLHPGDRVLMLSDGVVEARQPSRELFGFDRIHNLSNQTAFYIADAAKTFGQEDDITVLTVKRTAEVVAS